MGQLNGSGAIAPLLFCAHRERCCRFALIMDCHDHLAGGREHHAPQQMAPSRIVCAVIGAGDLYCCRFSRGRAAVRRRLSSDFLRDRMHPPVLMGGEEVKIVIWKSPKAISALLRRLFGIRDMRA